MSEVFKLAQEIWGAARLYGGFAIELFFQFKENGWNWIVRIVQLAIFALLLIPAFFSPVMYYFTSKNIIRDIKYGDNPRNYLDIFPALKQYKESPNKKAPVFVIVIGGAWLIGYKMWGAFLARSLQKRGILCVTLDFRNYPQGTVSDYLSDIESGLLWVKDNIQYYGGDPQQLYVSGQSSGGHLLTLLFLDEAINMQRASSVGNKKILARLPPTHFKGLLVVSGVLNIIDNLDYMDTRGLYKKIMTKALEAYVEDPKEMLRLLKQVDPVAIVSTDSFQKSQIGSFLPPTFIFHGTRDVLASFDSAFEFESLLRQSGCSSHWVPYIDKTHTDLIVEDLLLYGESADICNAICKVIDAGYHGDTHSKMDQLAKILEHDVVDKKAKRDLETQQPVLRILIELARFIGPF